MADTTGVLARLQAALSTYDPTWDISVGSATYKILESVANEIATANNNSTLQTYSYDINTKSGNDLDVFCNLFGVYRQLGKRAVGSVTFTTNAPATSIINIPIGTQVAVPIGNSYAVPIYYSTTAPAIIPIGAISISIPVIASLPGIYGNVPANTITLLANSLIGITSVTNLAPMTGGADPEGDTQLRSRWQNSAFNNTTGTNGKYILTAYQDPNVTTANAIGVQNFYDEQLTVQATISGGTTNNVTFQLIAYSGMQNVINGTTYSGTTLVSSSGFLASTSGIALASGLNAMISGVAPFNGVVFSVTPTGNTISGGLNIVASAPSPYRLTIGSGTNISTTTVTSGGLTISGTTYTSYLRSLNPDLGVSGTQSYNSTFSGYLYPQGNELVGSNLNSASEVIYQPNSDYYYQIGSTTVTGTFSPQLYLSIANASNNPNLFIGNTVEVISEYNPASNRSTTIGSGNYVDIFVNGTTAGLATEQSVYNVNNKLSPGTGTPYLNSNYYALGSGVLASSNTSTSGDIYIPFDRQPMINFPAQVSTASSGQADTFTLYNSVTNSGVLYPIALNPYGYIAFTGTVSPSTYYYTYYSAATNGTVSGGYSSPYIVFSGSSSFITNTAFSGTAVTIVGAANNSYNSTFTVVSSTSTTFTVYYGLNNPGTLSGTATATLDNSQGVTLSGATLSGQTFVNINNANTFLYPGLALINDGTVLSGQQYYIANVTSSGFNLNTPVTSTSTGTVTLTTSGKALAYPIYDITNSGNSVQSMTGIAVDTAGISSANGGFPSLPNVGGSWVDYTHNYNQDVTDVEALVQQSRPLGVNTLVHQASFQMLNISVRIVFSAGYSLTTIQSNINNQLQQYFSNFSYLNAITFANLQTQILNVAGVTNAKVTNVSTVAPDGTVINSYSSDFILASNQLPMLNNMIYTIVGTSTF